MRTIQIKEACLVAGEPKEPGDLVRVDPVTAENLISAGRGVQVPDDTVEHRDPQPEHRDPVAPVVIDKPPGRAGRKTGQPDPAETATTEEKAADAPPSPDAPPADKPE